MGQGKQSKEEKILIGQRTYVSHAFSGKTVKGVFQFGKRKSDVDKGRRGKKAQIEKWGG